MASSNFLNSSAAPSELIYPHTYFSPGILYEYIYPTEPQKHWSYPYPGDNIVQETWRWGAYLPSFPEWQATFNTAFGYWNNAHVAVYFTLDNSTSSNFIHGTYNSAYPEALGYTVIALFPSDLNEIWYFDIFINLTLYTPPYSLEERLFVAVHEIGHAIGAKHIPDDYPFVWPLPAVMKTHATYLQIPQRDDILLVNQIYR